MDIRMPPGLENVPGEAWRLLAARLGSWRTPVLASATPDGGDARIIVSRAVSVADRELCFFTDRRSRKHRQLEASPAVCLLVYDPERRWQLRLYGNARAEHDGHRLDRWWEGLGAHQRAHYAAEAPEPAEGREKGRENFAAYLVTVNRFHCLWLHDDGNEAAEFEWRDGKWVGWFVRP